MRFIEPAPGGIPIVELSRRNLLSLLHKLDDEASNRTLIDGDGKVMVHAVPDLAHYSDRPAGTMYMPSEDRYYGHGDALPEPRVWMRGEAMSDNTVREIVDLKPGDYWLTSSGDGTGRAIVTKQRELIIEQCNGVWSCLGIGVPDEWLIVPRTEHVGDGPDPWHLADQRVKQWAVDRAAAEAREDLVKQVADGLIQASERGDMPGWTQVCDIARAFLDRFDVTPRAAT